MTRLLGVIVLGLALTACPKKTPSTPGGGPDVPAAAGKPMAGNMAEAPHQAFPSTLTVKPECHQDNYLVLDVPEGKDFTIAVRPADGCVHISVMKENGSTNDMPNAEICADAPKPPMAAKGQAGKTFISMNEAGACKGISVTVDFN
jgi:hypothetical protein